MQTETTPTPETMTPPFKVLDASPEFQDMLSVIVDKSLELKPREMPVYWRMLREAEKSTIESYLADATPAPDLNKIMLHPGDYRAGLFQQQIVVRSVRAYPETEGEADPTKLIYEIWGSTQNAPLWLQILVTDSLPPEQTPESLQEKSIDMVGYFYKLQGYYPASGKSSDRPMISPLYIGKAQLASVQKPPPPMSTRFVSNETLFAILVGLLLCSLLLKNLVQVKTTRKRTKQRMAESWDWLEEEKEKT